MAKYILLTSCQVASQLFRYGEVLDEQHQPPTRLLAAGAKIAWLPNAAVEEWASRLASQRSRGSFDDQDPGYPLRDSVRQPFGATIDVNPLTGDDRSSGYPNTPIKTNVELQNRINGVPLEANLLVTHQAYPPSGTDPLRLDLQLRATRGQAGPTVTFQGPPLSTILTGTVGSTLPRVRSTNTPNAITQASLGATHVSLRARCTGGARAGARWWFAKNIGGGQLRVSEPCLVDLDPLAGQFQIPVVLAAADPFVVEQAPGIMMVDTIRASSNGGIYGLTQPLVYFLDYDFASWNLGATTPIENKDTALDFHSCRFTGLFPDNLTQGGTGGWAFRSLSAGSNQTWTSLLNCAALNQQVGFAGRRPGPNDMVDAGLYTQLYAQDGARLIVANDTLLQDPISGGTLAAVLASIDGGTLLVDAAGVMDARSAQVQAVLASRDGKIILTPSFYGLGGYIWGVTTTSSVFGMDIQDDGECRYRTAANLTVTGPGGDFRLGGRTTAEPFDLATRTYLAAVACSWSNLATPATSKDNLHDVTHNARIFKSTALSF